MGMKGGKKGGQSWKGRGWQKGKAKPEGPVAQPPSEWQWTQGAELMHALQLSQKPLPRSRVRSPEGASALLAAASPYDPLSQGTVATEEEIRSRGYAGAPTLPEGAPQAVPPDGLCLSYACVGAQNPRHLANMMRDRSGFVLNASESRKFRVAALNFRAAVAARATRAGRNDIAARLRSGEWPSEAALHFFAEELGGSLLITSIFAEEKILFGRGPIRVHVLHGLTEPDPDGHSSGHFELLQSWLPSDSGSSASAAKKKRKSSPPKDDTSESEESNKKAKPRKEKKDAAAADRVSEKPHEVAAFDPEEIWADYDEEKQQECATTAIPVSTCDQVLPRRKSALKTSWVYRAQRQRDEDEAWATWLASFDSSNTSEEFESLWKEFEKGTDHAPLRPTSRKCIPRDNDAILIVRDPWIGLILSGIKTLEIRGTRLRPQTMWLGTKGLIFGRARIESVREIETEEMWQELYPQHRWDRMTRPYRRTFAMHLTEVQRSSRPLHYRHPRGAIGIVKYHKPDAPRVTEAGPHHRQPRQSENSRSHVPSQILLETPLQRRQKAE